MLPVRALLRSFVNGSNVTTNANQVKQRQESMCDVPCMAKSAAENDQSAVCPVDFILHKHTFDCPTTSETRILDPFCDINWNHPVTNRCPQERIGQDGGS